MPPWPGQGRDLSSACAFPTYGRHHFVSGVLLSMWQEQKIHPIRVDGTKREQGTASAAPSRGAHVCSTMEQKQIVTKKHLIVFLPFGINWEQLSRCFPLCPARFTASPRFFPGYRRAGAFQSFSFAVCPVVDMRCSGDMFSPAASIFCFLAAFLIPLVKENCPKRHVPKVADVLHKICPKF